MIPGAGAVSPPREATPDAAGIPREALEASVPRWRAVANALAAPTVVAAESLGKRSQPSAYGSRQTGSRQRAGAKVDGPGVAGPTPVFFGSASQLEAAFRGPCSQGPHVALHLEPQVRLWAQASQAMAAFASRRFDRCPWSLSASPCQASDRCFSACFAGGNDAGIRAMERRALGPQRCAGGRGGSPSPRRPECCGPR